MVTLHFLLPTISGLFYCLCCANEYIYIYIYIYISIVDVDLEGIYVKMLEIFGCKYMYRNKERNEKVKKEIDFGFALAP